MHAAHFHRVHAKSAHLLVCRQDQEEARRKEEQAAGKVQGRFGRAFSSFGKKMSRSVRYDWTFPHVCMCVPILQTNDLGLSLSLSLSFSSCLRTAPLVSARWRMKCAKKSWYLHSIYSTGPAPPNPCLLAIVGLRQSLAKASSCLPRPSQWLCVSYQTAARSVGQA